MRDKGKTVFVNAALGVCSVVFTFLLLEMVLALFPGVGRDDEKLFFQSDQGWGNCYTADAAGYYPLQTTHQETKQPLHCIIYDSEGRRRGFYPQRETQCALIGDSFVFGEGLKEEDTLGSVLGATFPEVNFKNYGESGADISDIYRRMQQVIETQTTDISTIVYGYNLNDVLVSPVVNGRQKDIQDFQNLRLNNIPAGDTTVQRLFSKSVVARLVRKAFIVRLESARTVTNYRDMYFGPENGLELEKTVQYLVAMNRLAQSRGISFVVVLFPLFYKDEIGSYPFAPIHRLLVGLCRKNTIACIDVYPAFDRYYSLKRFIVNPVDFHPNAQAIQIISGYLSTQPQFTDMVRNR